MLTILLLGLAVLWVGASLLRRHTKPLPGEMGRITEKLPLMTVGLIAFTFCAAVTLVMFHGGDKQAPVLAFLALLSAGMVHLGCMPCLRWNEDGFVYRSTLGLTRRFAWQDRMYLTDHGLDFVLHVNHRCIVLPKYDTACASFLREIKKRRPLEKRSGVERLSR